MNFSAGPAGLPLPVLERAKEELLDYAGTGMSIMEQSHRGKMYERVHNEALEAIRRILHIPDDYAVLFLQGGASMQFSQVPLNFLSKGNIAYYIVNGTWGEKARDEARIVATREDTFAIELASTLEASTYTRAVDWKSLTVPSNAAYVHFTSNETVHGIQYAVRAGEALPTFGGTPVICDMSSDMMSRPIDVTKFDFIYAGAQKNLGPSGVLIAVAKRSFLASGTKSLPKFLQYRTHDDSASLYNTPPTFAIYLVRHVLSWIEEQGGLTAVDATNRTKAQFIYDAIAAQPEVFHCPVAKNSRSLMNVVFRLPTQADEERFIKEAQGHHMVGLKGHRSVGGIRVSLYNAVSTSDAKALAEFMGAFRL